MLYREALRNVFALKALVDDHSVRFTVSLTAMPYVWRKTSSMISRRKNGQYIHCTESGGGPYEFRSTFCYFSTKDALWCRVYGRTCTDCARRTCLFLELILTLFPRLQLPHVFKKTVIIWCFHSDATLDSLESL